MVPPEISIPGIGTTMTTPGGPIIYKKKLVRVKSPKDLLGWQRFFYQFFSENIFKNIFEKASGKSFRDDARASAPRRENAFPTIPTFQLPLHAEKSTLQNRRGSAEKNFTILPESLCISESPRRGIIITTVIIPKRR